MVGWTAGLKQVECAPEYRLAITEETAAVRRNRALVLRTPCPRLPTRRHDARRGRARVRAARRSVRIAALPRRDPRGRRQCPSAGAPARGPACRRIRLGRPTPVARPVAVP